MRLRALFCAAFIMHSPALADNTTDLLTELHLTMQRHVDQSLIGGAIQRRNLETGNIVRYYPIETHSMVMAMDEDYILCLDLATESGSSVPVDFYITETDRGFQVYQTEINNRERLKNLMRADRVERIR